MYTKKGPLVSNRTQRKGHLEPSLDGDAGTPTHLTDLMGHASENQPLELPKAAAPHDNDVHPVIFGISDNRLCGIALIYHDCGISGSTASGCFQCHFDDFFLRLAPGELSMETPLFLLSQYSLEDLSVFPFS
jgi:hypothetical protein